MVNGEWLMVNDKNPAFVVIMRLGWIWLILKL